MKHRRILTGCNKEASFFESNSFDFFLKHFMAEISLAF